MSWEDMNHSNTTVLINGDASQQISCHDRGLNFGDGLFETIAVLQGHLRYWEPHMQRLLEGCSRLQIELPDIDQLKLECQSVLTDAQRQVIKIMVTRGTGGQGYAYTAKQPSTRIIIRKPWPCYSSEKLERGVRVGYSSIEIHAHPQLASIKHLNALQQVLATADCKKQGFDECLRQNTKHELIEGCKSNLFLVKDDQLYTPHIANYGIAGIMRNQVMAKAIELNLSVKELSLYKDDVMQADELFLTNSLIGLWPIIDLAGHAFVKGKWTHRLIESLGIPAYYS